MSVFQELLDLLLPARCLYCNLPPKQICESCLAYFAGRNRAVVRGQLKGLSLVEFDRKVSAAISAFKEVGQFAIARLLVARLITEQSIATLQQLGATMVVALPSSKASFAKRGFTPAEVVADSLARGVGLPIFKHALWLCRHTEDQASLDVQGRAGNLVEAMQASELLSGRRVLLVDDIVTTGASLIEAARAVQAVGGEAVGFFTIAETILRNAPRDAFKV